MPTILMGDVRGTLKSIPEQTVQCCVTSPPYFGLRDYGHIGQIGLEQTPAEYVEQMVAVFREVRRVLRDDGTLWLNLGDSYANDTKWGGATSGKHVQAVHGATGIGRRRSSTGYKSKELMGIPWQVAFALSADGWYLRQDIIWHKPNPMPESVRDRCTKAHEYVFLLSKSERYYFDSVAMQEPATGTTSHDATGRTKQRAAKSGNKQRKPATERDCPRDGTASGVPREGFTRNKRSVWTVATKPYKEAHFATFPPALIEPCILAGSRFADTVLDPFLGSGTTAEVAIRHGRKILGCELNPEYRPLIDARIAAAEAEVLW